MFEFLSNFRPSEKTYLSTIVENVLLLADYAEDTKRSLDKVQKARKLIYKYDIDKNSLSDTEVDELLQVERELTPSSDCNLDCEVTIDTLRATGGFSGNQYFSTSAGRYMMWLWFVLFTMIGLAVYADYQIHLPEYLNVPGDEIDSELLAKIRIIHYLNPYIFGTLGACAYLLRVTGQRLHTRTFDPARFPEHLNRLFLGTLSGGMIIIFFEGSVVLQGQSGSIPISAVALGFIAGYSVDFLYQTVDRIVSAIIPNISADVVKPQALKKKHSLLTTKYRNLLDKLDGDASKDPVKKKDTEKLKDMLEMMITDLRD